MPSPMRIDSPFLVRRGEEYEANWTKMSRGAVRPKAVKRQPNNGMLPPDPATNVIKGFVMSGDESDRSTTSTPMLRPVNGGISLLKAQIDGLHLDKQGALSTGTSTPMSKGSTESDCAEFETYDVSLADFVSPNANDTSPLRAMGQGQVCRKMNVDDFGVLRCLGKGAFGTVHLVKQHDTGRLYAQKQFKKASLTVHKRLIEQTRTERAILESINRHPFVVKLYYAFHDKERLYLILQYAPGGELFHHLSSQRMFSVETAAFYMAEMVLALEHLHHNVRVIYRDLKPENCLLDADGHLLLTDFGLSKVALEGEETTHTIVGTIEYMAPEVFLNKGYDFAVDWWSLGAIGFDLMTGSPPFPGGNRAKIESNIVKAKLQLPKILGPDAQDLLTRLLRKDPRKRLHGPALKAHRFFRKIDWKKLERRELTPPIQPFVSDPELAENFDKEFTELPLSPVLTRDAVCDGDPFGGFSFVASSLLRDEFAL
ncbi:kinase-like protein [Piedraia hortae CBS 480.64]|uniref:Kinase-like protein n=1 Tax=Piedraia hortae CBS 480.64 TaxID=1314780 RepID=A0A6A7C8U4_9PEZI|nr:kinase-like protein [Piedraia hortae CBS 480.64]